MIEKSPQGAPRGRQPRGKGTTVAAILAYGAYVPPGRLDRGAIAATLGQPAGRGTRSVASHDEDSTTLGVEAARLALGRAGGAQGMQGAEGAQGMQGAGGAQGMQGAAGARPERVLF